MKTNKTSLKLAVVGLAVTSVLTGIAACSSDDNANPSPGDDGGNTADQTASSSGSGSSSGTGSSSGMGSSSGTDSGGSSGSGDSGCVADATPNCSSCASSSADPYNSCSAFTVNCVPFDNAVLPSPYPTF